MSEVIRVLHVDGDADFLERAANALERETDRLTVETALTVDEALARVAENTYDCIVSGHDLPDETGIEFLEAVRETQPALPFILFTGEGSEALASEAISAGVTDYLRKVPETDRSERLADHIVNAVERTRARVTAQRDQDRLRRLSEAFPDIAFYIDEDGRYRDVIAGGQHSLLYDDLDEILGQRLQDVLPADTANRFDDVVQRALETGDVQTIDYQLDVKAGNRWFEARVMPLEMEPSDRETVIAAVRDITEHKQRERELERSRERYRSLFENNPLVIWEQDFSAGKAYLDELETEVDDIEAYLADHPDEIRQLMDRMEITDINENALDYYEADSKTELLANFDQVFTEAAFESFTEACLAIATGDRQYRTETVARTLNGDTKHELLEVYVPDAYADDLSRIYTTGMDITERKEQEEELRRKNQRLEEFTEIVSHDLRNPLNVAMERVTLAQQECDTDHLADVEQAHERMRALIDDLLQLAREGQSVSELEPVALSETVEKCWQNVDTRDADYVVHFDHVIEADEARLLELLENLVRNAVEHGGEDITITFGELPDGFYVADDGPGVPEDEREQVFEGGYSTAAEGTGFGLAIVREIVDAHDWDIQITDSDHGGARFEITGVDIAE